MYIENNRVLELSRWLSGKESAASARTAGYEGSVPELGRSPAEGNGNPLQYSCLENSMDRGAWWATVHGVARVGHDLETKPLLPLGGGSRASNELISTFYN